MRQFIAGFVLLGFVAPATGQVHNLASIDHANHRLAGRIVDYTHNHGADRRIVSTALGMPRDLYVYLPPGYCPSRAYPLVIYLHMAFIDEHTFVGSRNVFELDRMIQDGVVPPMIVACPDGFFSGRNHFTEPHSFYVNGKYARFEDHIMGEVVPFLFSHFAIRPEREAHALFGVSAGAFGALNLAIKHRAFFGAVATLAPPANLRYSNEDGVYRQDFDPATYRWEEQYDPNQVIGRFLFGLRRTRARAYMAPVFGEGHAEVYDRIIRENPADLIFSTNLQPGELAIYLNYPARDNFNFDAQAESFQWLAASRGIAVDAEPIPHARHTLHYFNSNHPRAFLWLGGHVLPPTACATHAGPFVGP